MKIENIEFALANAHPLCRETMKIACELSEYSRKELLTYAIAKKHR